MNTKCLFILWCVSLFFGIGIQTAKASTEKFTDPHIILVQNKIDLPEDYPVVTQIETKVLGKNYQEEDIYKRLSRIETALFGAVSQKSLSDRVDDLSKAVIGSNNNFEDEENYNQSSNSFNDDSLKNLLNKLEKQIMNQVYPNDTDEARVSRLEQFIFNQSSDDYPMNERIERLATVIKAQPSSEIKKDIALLNNSQMFSQGLSLAALIIMIIAGLAF